MSNPTTSGIVNAIISGSTLALRLVNQFLTNPTLAGVTIICEKYTEMGASDVSQSLLIAGGQGKEWVTDNIAPKPRTWKLQGYLAPDIWELTTLSPILQPSLKAKKDKLRNARLQRTPVDFRPLYGEDNLPLSLAPTTFGTMLVGITDLEFDYNPEVANHIPISVTVQEVKILTVVTQNTNIAIPGVGGADGDVANAGNVAGKAEAHDISVLKATFAETPK